MKTLSEFEIFYRSELNAVLIDLDARRRRMVKRTFLIITLMCLFVPFSYIIVQILGEGFEDETRIYAFLILSFIGLTAGLIIMTKWARDKTFYSDFKKEIIERIVKFVSPELHYDAKSYVNYDSFRNSRIFMKSADRYRGDDLVHGMLDKTKIWFSEIKAEYETTSTDSDGKTSKKWHTIFKGLFFVADFNKHFNTSTVVLPNRLGKGALANFFNKINLTRKEKHISLEDPDFNKQFVVYSMDQVEARYILSPALMQRLTSFKQKHKPPMYISFVNSLLYVAIAYKRDLFEPRYLSKIADYQKIKQYFEDIHLAVSIVEELNLNNRIWTKE